MLDNQDYLQKLCQIEMCKARIAGMQAHNLIMHTNNKNNFYAQCAFENEVRELYNILDSLR